MYYCVSDSKDALYLDELMASAENNPNFDVSLVASNEAPRLSAEQISAELGSDIRDAHVYFCGPTPMRDALKKGLVADGLRASRFHRANVQLASS